MVRAPEARNTSTEHLTGVRSGVGEIPTGALTLVPGSDYELDGRRVHYHGKGISHWFETPTGKLYDVAPEFVADFIAAGLLKPCS